MTRKLVTLLPLLLALTAPGAAAATLLRLSDTASLRVPPDELVAELRVAATAPSAAAAQAAVNRAMAEALAVARKQSGVAISTAGYATWQRPPGAPGGGVWQASQDLSLRARDGASLLRLVGGLQQRGLAVASLSWTLSSKARAAAEAKAMARAIAALRGRAAAAAGLLGMRFVAFRTVTLGAPPTILPRAMFAGAALAAMPAPSAVGSAIAVSATVSAEAELEAK